MELEATHDDPDGWPTRQELAGQLGVDERTIRRWERVGKLRSIRDSEGRYRVAPAEFIVPSGDVSSASNDNSASLLACSSTESALTDRTSENESAGTIASRVFKAFSAGLSPREVVIELALTPDAVLKAHTDWVSLGDDITLHESHRQTLEELGVVVNSADGVVSLFRRLVGILHAYERLALPCDCGCGRLVPLTLRLASRLRRAARNVAVVRDECSAAHRI